MVQDLEGLDAFDGTERSEDTEGAKGHEVEAFQLRNPVHYTHLRSPVGVCVCVRER
jgi:hypothetical protein